MKSTLDNYEYIGSKDHVTIETTENENLVTISYGAVEVTVSVTELLAAATAHDLLRQRQYDQIPR